MPLIAAICAIFLMVMSGNVYSETRTDISYLVTHLYLITALLCCAMVKINVKPGKSKDEPTGSSKVPEGTEGQSPKD